MKSIEHICICHLCFPTTLFFIGLLWFGFEGLATFCHELEGFDHCWQEDSLFADIQHHIA
jgi:hypothetical protein